MNVASIVVFAVVIAFAAFAVWRCVKKGMPCECGGGKCRGRCCCEK